MGVHLANIEFAWHKNPGGSIDRQVRYHFGNKNISASHDLTAIEVGKLKADVSAQNQGSFETHMNSFWPGWAFLNQTEKDCYWSLAVDLWS